MTLDELYKIFTEKESRKIFPYLRKDYLERMLLKGQVIIENSDEIPCGCLVWMQYRKSSHRQIGSAGDIQICEIVVKEEKQRNGIGKRLFQLLEAMARQRGSRRICVAVRQSNDKARAFYEKMGMSVCGEKQWIERGNRLPGAVYEKRLGV